jgi:hypothetical protein
MKLWNIWQRTTSNHPRARRMETLHPGITSHHPYLLRSQKPDVLSRRTKTESATSEMVALPLQIWCQTNFTLLVQSDTLSRRPDFVPHEEWQWQYNYATWRSICESIRPRLTTTNCNDLDTDATEALKLLVQSGPANIQQGLDDWPTETVNGKHVLFFKGKNYIPQNIEPLCDIVKSFHDHETARHPGELETFNSIWQYYWWPGLRTFVKNYD